MRNVRALVVVVAAVLPVAACSSHSEAAQPDAAVDGGAGGGDAGIAGDGGSLDAPAGPDLSCVGVAVPATAADPITLGGTVETFALGVGAQPVDGAALVSFRTGKPDVLARGATGASGAFTTGALATGGHPLDAYLKATKPGYRTTFLYPPYPFAQSAAAIPLPMISDPLFASVTSAMGATQDDHADGALLVAVVDCSGHLVPGATLTVERGHTAVGHTYDLGPVVPGAGGVFLVLDVPDGKVGVSARDGDTTFPTHDVVVRAEDPCPGSPATLTATAVVPGP